MVNVSSFDSKKKPEKTQAFKYILEKIINPHRLPRKRRCTLLPLHHH